MSKCDVCEKEAEFNIPAELCEEHWMLHWYGEMFQDMDAPPDDADEKEIHYFDLSKKERVVVVNGKVVLKKV